MRTILNAIRALLGRPSAGRINLALSIIETTAKADTAPRPVPAGTDAR